MFFSLFYVFNPAYVTLSLLLLYEYILSNSRGVFSPQPDQFQYQHSLCCFDERVLRRYALIPPCQHGLVPYADTLQSLHLSYLLSNFVMFLPNTGRPRLQNGNDCSDNLFGANITPYPILPQRDLRFNKYSSTSPIPYTVYILS